MKTREEVFKELFADPFETPEIVSVNQWHMYLDLAEKAGQTGLPYEDWLEILISKELVKANG